MVPPRPRLPVIFAIASLSCTPAEPSTVEPPAVPTILDRLEEPADPRPWGRSRPTRRLGRHAMGQRMVLVRAAFLEALAGRHVAYDDGLFSSRHTWVESTSRRLCLRFGCDDACVARMRFPGWGDCGTGADEAPDIISVDIAGCGPDRSYRYAVRYDPLVLGDVAEYLAGLEEIPFEMPER